LLAVAIALAVLTLLIGVVVQSAQLFVARTATSLRGVQLQAALDAGSVTVVSALSAPAAGPRQQTLVPQALTMNGASVKIAVRPEASKINLNYADRKLISALLQASNISAAMAEKLTQEVVAARERDADVKYSTAPDRKLTSGPAARTTPFETISDLARIADGGPDLVTCLESDVTIYSGRADVDLSDASERVRRATLMTEPGRVTPLRVNPPSTIATSPGEVFEITISADTSSAPNYTRQLIVRLTGNARDPYWILHQQAPAPEKGVADAACRRYKEAHDRP